MTARRTKLIKESGPYRVRSMASGKLRIYPSWNQFPQYSDEDGDEDGGGPGVISRMQLAREIEAFLNVETKEGG